MAPQASLRGILAYVAGLFSYIPSINELPSPSKITDWYSPPSSLHDASYVPFSGAPACPLDGQMSCHNSTPVTDSCCLVHPGGRMLLTQFWDRETHVDGGDEDWTLHGLW
jgi:ribonuclease T2